MNENLEATSASGSKRAITPNTDRKPSPHASLFNLAKAEKKPSPPILYEEEEWCEGFT